MAFSLAPLLAHSDAVPLLARQALLAAERAPTERREEFLEQAARVLYRETDLECRDVRELVGLALAAC